MSETSTAEILTKGMNCLIESIGVVEAERFISAVIREKFDYTKWQRDFFDSAMSAEFNEAAVKYCKENPLK